MIRLASILFILVFAVCTQVKAQTDEKLIELTITDFLYWHKKTKTDSINRDYSIIKNIIIDKKFKRQIIDKNGIEKYLSFYKRSNYLSDTYINNLRGYFYAIGKDLDKNPPVAKNAIIKIDGLDLDVILQSFEPELILDFINNGIFKQIIIVSSKAIVQFYIPDYSTKMLFTLTEINGKWLIDDISYYE